MDTQLTTELESVKLWINFAASIGLAFAIGGLTVFVYGRDNSLAHRFPAYLSWLLKIGLTMCSAGALFNAITFSNPNWSEVFLNVGLCIVLGWAAWFHYTSFVKPWQNPSANVKKTKKQK